MRMRIRGIDRPPAYGEASRLAVADHRECKRRQRPAYERLMGVNARGTPTFDLIP
jgi:hypothetical protein